MNWRRLERWAIIATIALYAAAAASFIILLGESLLPESSPVQRVFQDTANWLNRLGDIGGGTIIIIILLVLAGGGIYVLFLKAIDKYHENRERRARERAEWEAEARSRGLAQGRAEGRTEGRAEILEELRKRGVNVDDLVPPTEPDSEAPET